VREHPAADSAANFIKRRLVFPNPNNHNDDRRAVLARDGSNSDELALRESIRPPKEELMMWYRSYRDHVIMPFPSFDTASKSWAPQASISWVAGSMRDSVFLRFPQRTASEDDAVVCAASCAKIWIDKHIEEDPGRRDQTGARKDVVHRPTGLFVKPASRQSRRIQPRIPRRPQTPLTFEDFKTQLLGRGVTLDERSLVKSYAALIQLHKNSHCTWSQIKSRLKRSQEILAAAKSTQRRTKAGDLPLTSQDWRRII